MDPDNLLTRSDDMEVSKTSLKYTTVSKTFTKDTSEDTKLFLVDISDITITFLNDDSPMDLNKTLVKPDDGDSTFNKEFF